ncbi:MAG: hypothetical protein U0838_06680 [Chloroflexota bacterium]
MAARAGALRYRFNGNHRDGSKILLEMHARTILIDGVKCRHLRQPAGLSERDRLDGGSA